MRTHAVPRRKRAAVQRKGPSVRLRSAPPVFQRVEIRRILHGPRLQPQELKISRVPGAQLQRAIPATINGVTMEKGSSVDDSSLKSVVTDQLDAVIASTMDGITVDAIYVSSANDSTHGENSRHYTNLAVDLSRLKTAGATGWQYMSEHYPDTENVKKVVDALQNGFEDQVGTPGIRENFGPYIKKKNGSDWTVGGHGDHIHISCNE